MPITAQDPDSPAAVADARAFNSVFVEPSYDGIILRISLRPQDGKGSWIEFETFGQSLTVLRLVAWAVVQRYVLRQRPAVKPLYRAKNAAGEAA